MFKSVYMEVSGGRNELFGHAGFDTLFLSEIKAPIRRIKIIHFTTTQISYKQSKKNVLFSKITKLINGFFSKLCLHYIYLD